MDRQLPENSSEGLEHSKLPEKPVSIPRSKESERKWNSFINAISFLFPGVAFYRLAWIGITIFMVIVLFVALNFAIGAKSFGDDLGAGVGKAIGSLEGMTKGYSEGTAAGKAKGLSAEDTEANIASSLEMSEKLEVLVASVRLSNFHTIGEEENPDYAALYLANGAVVFTVDLGQAEVNLDGDTLCIILPLPEGELCIDESSIERKSQYQKYFFSGSADSGFDAYINTMKKQGTVSEETLSNYSELLKAAKLSAENQVKKLVATSSITCKTTEITFKQK